MRQAGICSIIGATLLASTAMAQDAGPVAGASASTAHPDLWPQARSRGLVDPATEAFVTELMTRMSLEEKVGQMIQADTSAITPDDLRRYPLGSILSGGSSPPLGRPDRSPGPDWAATVNAFEAVAMEPRTGHTAIPLIFGIDAVHGNNNVVGATLFPHNIALGATRNLDLTRRIGDATAQETAAAGIHWAFGPTLAVPQDDRWGRTYEGYSEDPQLVRAFSGAMVEGLQGKPGLTTIQVGRVAASAKHFLGDGGTTSGVDQGNTELSEAELIATHAPGYPPAINGGVMTIMASFNSWNGQKMHGNRSLLTDVLKGRMGFDGFIVGDWNGHAQVAGCTKTDCAASFNAGLDMAMAPDSWQGLFDTTLAQVRAGTIPMERVDDAVRRILRVKHRLGLFDTARPFADRPGVIGAPAHRAIAREAVRQSLVLLKNDGVLPLRPDAKLLVAGTHADDIGLQSGGWTLSWQGDGNSNADFPNAQSIYAGLAEAVRAGGGSATLSADGSFTDRPDAAIVVFGEMPYAEGRGDVRTLEFEAGDKQSLALLQRLKAAGIPTVSVFLSGRPLWVNPELNQSDAFVAGWLPGSEGGGIADVLIAGPDGAPRHDFRGRLSFSWPKTAGQFTLNVGQDGYDPLFPYDYGLSYAQGGSVPQLAEEAGVDASLANTGVFFARGRVPGPFALQLDDTVTQGAVDSPLLQEGALQLRWRGAGTARITGPELALSRETNGDTALQLQYRMDRVPAGPVQLTLGNGALDVAGLLVAGGWRSLRVPLHCFAPATADAPVTIRAAPPFTLSLAEARLVNGPEGAQCPAK
ncbi:1,4-beta-D-glucan glucohydrolase [Croceibacterium mercuriale]|uniref:1,4-beta-D-glucan glucohydrolase n=1 Tax=Croceibacterium mercuriale TaxID=1572751 RepID=A0A0B2BXS8_9SPHN|nr:glycoside hydrolase family 3 protein [Croceibacterium mercuriale]KHL24645.1 1,4-beta-D-glucan glucohydrolase [Croceibacterium mercuriale]